MHPRRRTLRRTLGLGVLAILVVLVPSACGGREKDAKARPLPEKQQTLSRGLYRSEEFEVGGVEGLQVDVVVGNLPEDYQGRCGTDCVDSGRVEGVSPLKNDIFTPADDKERVTFLDVEGKTVTISITSPASVFDDFVPEAQMVLDSVKWRGS